MEDYAPKFQRGDMVRIPTATPGHDRHDPKVPKRIEKVYPGKDARHTSYKLEGDPSIWPETRLA